MWSASLTVTFSRTSGSGAGPRWAQTIEVPAVTAAAMKTRRIERPPTSLRKLRRSAVALAKAEGGSHELGMRRVERVSMQGMLLRRRGLSGRGKLAENVPHPSAAITYQQEPDAHDVPSHASSPPRLLAPPALADAAERTVYVTVTDGKGAAIKDLTAADLVVKEGGKEREIVKAAPGHGEDAADSGRRRAVDRRHGGAPGDVRVHEAR